MVTRWKIHHYVKFDESSVPMFSLDLRVDSPKESEFKYPKAGEKNSTVKVFLYNLAKKKQVSCKGSVQFEKPVIISLI